MQRDFYKELKALVLDHEGLKLTPYRCPAGKLTIGCGRNLDDNGISEQEAMYLFYNDLARTHDDLRSNLPVYSQLSSPRQMALIDMCFNLGLPGFLSFKKMLAALERGDYQQAAAEMLDSGWARQVGQRAMDLAELTRKG